MTAIAGYWSFGSGSTASHHCAKMLESLLEYGSNSTASGKNGSLALGRNLFALLPEDAFDRQPLFFGDGRYSLVADLRLDNRDELTGALGLTSAEAREFADSALLGKALERWGADCLHKVVGDFAFAWFDALEQRLTLARDPLGQRPLFWHRGKGFVAFASMPKGIHVLPEVERRADRRTLSHFIGLLPQSGPGSYFESVQRVEPGHFVSITRTDSSSRRYWNPQRRELRLAKFSEYVDAFRAELDQAVESRLRGAGQSVASHLSGGWDSSSVTATAARLMEPRDGKVIAFTSVPAAGAAAPAPDNRFVDEGPMASATASLYPNIEHIFMPGSSASPIEKLDFYLNHFERPLHNLCNHVWLSEIRQTAREKGAQILLTGEIGNWTISSAPGNILADLIRQRRVMAWWREATAAFTTRRSRLRGVLANSFGPWVPDLLWNRMRHLSSAPEMSIATALHPALRREIEREQDAQGLGLAWRPKDNFSNIVNGLYAMDWGEYRKGILGGWGIDKRDATADTRLIDFCLSLPLDMLLKDGVRRPLARAALADRLPAAVLDERRKGYQAADWSIGLSQDLDGVKALIDRIAANPTAAELIDTDLLRELVGKWPDKGWEEPGIRAQYRTALLHALSAGHFIAGTTR